MKALILAGGFGTRLRPLSCTRPKLLFPIANRPILDLTLERLAANGVSEAVIAVNFMADALEQACGKSKYGIELHYSRDAPSTSEDAHPSPRALGTGGPVKQAEKLLKTSSSFFVLNGDILTAADYSKIMKQHKKNGHIATIALYKVKDPSHYGVVELKGKRIIRFVEKPSKKDLPSNLINAGIYVFEPDIFRYIQAGKKCSLEREVFPKLAEEGELYGCEIRDLWIDIGKPADYILANRLWLEAEMGVINRSAKVRVEEHIDVKEPVALAVDVSVGKGSVIGPNVSLGRKVSVGENVQIKNSIILPYTTISDFTSIEGAMIGESVTIGKSVKVEKGCLIGDNTIVQDGVTLVRNVKVCPWKEISEDVLTPGCVM